MAQAVSAACSVSIGYASVERRSDPISQSNRFSSCAAVRGNGKWIKPGSSSMTWQRQVMKASSVGRLHVVNSASTEPPAADSGEKKSRKRKTGRGSRIIGTGSAVPAKVVTNDFLASLMDTSDEWISTRTGIRNRHVLSEDETMTGLATEASRKALEMAGVDAADVDLIIFCTSTPDDIFGGGCLVQRDLGCKRAVAFDLTAACSGFVLGLVTASRFIQGGGYERVLVVGADGLSRYVDWSDRGTCILFGDGCGAVLVQAAAEGESDGLLGFDMHSDGYGSRHLHACFSVTPAPEESGSIAGRAVATPIIMNGKEVYKFAVTTVPQVLQAALQEAELSSDDIDWLLLHQANQRIMDAVATKMHIPYEKVISNVASYGNTSAASIPIALDEAVRSGKVKPGDVVATAGFGAGLTWASAIVRYG
ncbi:hypothetical protein CLOM_g22283 [Closterium sp. NIES-68]|nr:hypothetical protein CLOM_g22283 [Closterium sp. NIES-68]GJP64446.1 hypothetical protein CLOP_g21435 [Closterium sp. NIES-67]